ncbi:hypothetical protein GPECTOR_19g217 [Gonium pectorale]|uniref:Uncharacterized protein n=1 Tax=Gonium pectorale TaxID=33097 RepID=A0A150GJ02_GONPE|nr:hypothetical protein GPECTOR_19g217 [Gonium pectorale]|eukprot:KXZ49766.1 hypothetical protein GPECTOR_19g217 [Gonium pectorale]
MPSITGEVNPELVALLVDGARYGDMEDVDAALSQGVPVDSKDSMGRTALHMACANGHVEVITRLLEAGALTDVTNSGGNTPLHWACLNGHMEDIFEVINSYNTAGSVQVEVQEGGEEGEGGDGEGEGEQGGGQLGAAPQAGGLARRAFGASAAGHDSSGGGGVRPSGASDEPVGAQRQSHQFDPRDGTSFSRNDMPSNPATVGEFDADGYYGGHPPNESIKREIERPENTYQSGLRAGMHKPGDYVVRELDEQGREVGVSGPDPGAPRGTIWHHQTIEHAMGNASTEPPNPDRPMDRRSPAGGSADDLDHLRPMGAATDADPGAHVRQRIVDVAKGAWETLKHGVNNAGQPQIIEELKRTAPETGDESAVLRQPRSTASRGEDNAKSRQ